MHTNPARTLTISINCLPARVQAFVTDPRNLPTWAHGLGKSVRNESGRWFVTTPAGEVSVRFAEQNSFGVSEVLFTLFQPTAMSDEQFTTDIGLVEQDLQRLKQVLEGAAA